MGCDPRKHCEGEGTWDKEESRANKRIVSPRGGGAKACICQLLPSLVEGLVGGRKAPAR